MNERRDSRGQVAKVLVVIVLSIVLIFTPLILAGVESVLLGSHRVEGICRTIGVFNALDAIYKNTVFRIFK